VVGDHQSLTVEANLLPEWTVDPPSKPAIAGDDCFEGGSGAEVINLTLEPNDTRWCQTRRTSGGGRRRHGRHTRQADERQERAGPNRHGILRLGDRHELAEWERC
jgi:hypothetical protein